MDAFILTNSVIRRRICTIAIRVVRELRNYRSHDLAFICTKTKIYIIYNIYYIVIECRTPHRLYIMTLIQLERTKVLLVAVITLLILLLSLLIQSMCKKV